MSRKIALLMAGLLVAPIAIGCGDDDGGGGTALSKDEYIARGDEICAEANDEIEDRSEELFSGDEPSEEDVERFTLEVSVPTIEEEIDRLRDLPAPQGDGERLNIIYAAAETGIAELREDPSLSARGELPAALDRSNELAREYGFEDCGEEG